MVESDIRRYFKLAGSPNPAELADIKDAVSSGLQLEQGIGDRVTPEVIDEMVGEIAVGTYYASDFLNNAPWPNYGLTHEWGTRPPDRHQSEGKRVLATASVDVKNPYGLICFSPVYLEGIADYKMERFTLDALDFASEHPLPKVTEHEDYHIFQYTHFPKTLERQVEVFVSLGLSEWEKTRAERSARLFEDIFESARIRKYGAEHMWDRKGRIYISRP